MFDFVMPLYEWVAHNAIHNELFAGFVGAAAIGMVAYHLRSVFGSIWGWFLYTFTMEITITNDTDVFYWMSIWINTTSYATRMRRVRVLGRIAKRNSKAIERAAKDISFNNWVLAPGSGRHFFLFGKRLVVMERLINENASKGSDFSETITVRILGRDISVIQRILNEAMSLSEVEEEFKVKVYTWMVSDGYWEYSGEKFPRSCETVIMDAEVRDSILEDIKWFGKSYDWYNQRGIPYRRSYLFSGPPGTGKTSLVRALATHFERKVYVLSMGDIISDSGLVNAFCDVPNDAILLMEDIDSVQRNRSIDTTDEKTKGSLGFSLSGLLNAMDGVSSPEGIITVMTTNYPERIDAALLRPGRTDVHVTFDVLSAAQATTFFHQYFPDEALDLGGNSPGMTAAELQGLFMECLDNPAKVRDTLLERIEER